MQTCHIEPRILEYVPQEINAHFIIQYKDAKFVAMHIVKEKWGIYDHQYHDVVKQFAWKSNNGYFVTRITHDNKTLFPNLPYNILQEVRLDRLIMEYLENQPCPKTLDSKKKTANYVIEHINNMSRDNRLENLRWITVRHYDDVRHPKFYWKKVPKQLKDMGITTYPKYIKWLDKHNAFVIDDHPLKLLDHEHDRRNNIRIFSSKAKAVTPYDKLCEIQNMLADLNKREYMGYTSFDEFCEYQNVLLEDYNDMIGNIKSYLINNAKE